MANRDAKINALARNIQTDAGEIVYHSSSGYITETKMETIGAYLNSIEQAMQEISHLIRSEPNHADRKATD